MSMISLTTENLCSGFNFFFQQLEVERFRHAKSAGDHATKQMAQRVEDVCRPQENASRCVGQLTRGKRFILKSTSATLEMLQRKSKKNYTYGHSPKISRRTLVN